MFNPMMFADISIKYVFPFVAQLLNLDPSRTKFKLTDKEFSWMSSKLYTISYERIHLLFDELEYRGISELLGAICWYFVNVSEIDAELEGAIHAFVLRAVADRRQSYPRKLDRLNGVPNAVCIPNVREPLLSSTDFMGGLCDFLKNLELSKKHAPCELISLISTVANAAREDKARMLFIYAGLASFVKYTGELLVSARSGRHSRDVLKGWIKLILITYINLAKAGIRAKDAFFQYEGVYLICSILHQFDFDCECVEYGFWALFNICNGFNKGVDSLFQAMHIRQIMMSFEKWYSNKRVAVRGLRLLNLARQSKKMDMHLDQLVNLEIDWIIEDCAADEVMKRGILTMLDDYGGKWEAEKQSA